MAKKPKPHPAPISQKKIEANRNNAQKSTGPISPMGKDIVRWNALKHGLLAKEIILNSDGSDASTQFEFLLTELRNDHRPEGVLEEMLIERIAVCYWLLRRVLRTEKGEIEQRLDLSESSKHLIVPPAQYGSLRAQYQQAKGTARGTSIGIRILLEAILDLQKSGKLAPSTEADVCEVLGEAGWIFFKVVPSVLPSPTGEADPKDVTAERIRQLEDRIEELTELEKILHQNEEFTSNAKAASLNLPSKEVADKILRYENSIQRDLYRAMNQLERLQRQRKGEYVPPPVNVDGVEGLK